MWRLHWSSVFLNPTRDRVWRVPWWDGRGCNPPSLKSPRSNIFGQGKISHTKSWKSHPQKKQDFRVGSNWLNFCCLSFWGCQLHQFWQFLCSSCWKFPEFSGTHPTFWICMILKDVMDKNKKNRNQKICQFEPTLKFNLFWGWDYSSFFFNHMPQKYQNEKLPILNHQKNPKH